MSECIITTAPDSTRSSLWGLYPQGLKYGSAASGGYTACSFQVFWPWSGLPAELGAFYRCQVVDGLTTVWDGEIREIQRSRNDYTLLDVVAYGHGILLKDFPYNRVWQDNRYGSWREVSSVQGADRFDYDVNGRLSIIPKVDEQAFWIKDDLGVLRFRLPATAYHADHILKVAFDYDYDVGDKTAAFGFWVLEVAALDDAGAEIVAGAGEVNPRIIAAEAAGSAVGSFSWATNTGGGNNLPASTRQLELRLRSNSYQCRGPAYWADDSGKITYLGLQASGGSWDVAENIPANEFQNSGGQMHFDEPEYEVIVSSSVANPSVITTTNPHNLTTGDYVVIAGHAGSTPSINGLWQVTVTAPTTFTIPVNVTVGGTGGTMVTNLYAMVEFTGTGIMILGMMGNNFGKHDYYLFNVSTQRVVTSSSVAAATVITATGHGLVNGDVVVIQGHSGSKPDLNYRPYTVTKLTDDTFTIPVNVSTGGTGGTVTKCTFSSLNVDAYADPAQYHKVLYKKTELSHGDYFLINWLEWDANVASGGHVGSLDEVAIYTGSPFTGDKKQVHATLTNVVVSTTLSTTITADDVADDIVSKASVAAIGLSSSTGLINSGSTRNLLPLVFDVDGSAHDALQSVCAAGDHNNKPIQWGVWDNKQLTVELVPIGTPGYYQQVEDVSKLDISQEWSEIILETYGVYKDADGFVARTTVRTSANAAGLYAGRKRIIPFPLPETIVSGMDQRQPDKRLGLEHASSTVVDNYLQTRLGESDDARMASAVTTRSGLLDSTGTPMRLNQARAGNILQLLQFGLIPSGSDLRDHETGFMVAETDYDAEQRELTLSLDNSHYGIADMLVRAYK